MNNKIRSAISHFLVALLVLFSTLTLSAPSAVAQTPQADSKQVGTTYRGILFRCLQDKWPDIQIGDPPDSAFVPETGQNLAWDSNKKTWIDTKTLQSVLPFKTLRGAMFSCCLQKKWPDIQIGDPPDSAFVPETGQNLAWDNDKQAWIDTKTLECICPKCPPPRVTTTPAPPSKQEKGKEEKGVEKGKEKEGEEVEVCKSSVGKRPSIKNVTGTGEGCSENEARTAARNNAAELNCKNEKDPKCTKEGCAKQGGTCKVTAGATAGDKKVCEKITKVGCKQGWKCEVTGTYACDCDCR